ncbi:AAA family ATPase [Rhizobium rhizogenes]|uniref:AAA family ATPase n=1 Tax=Rhizobium rhizogenes TaxID=359 RepID=UPI0022BFCD4B|nr:AAA family ATPase [Rhizobium rhizogenes]MCZ7486055.1 AAA family ATPase [Rhizobium rhizogenes]
MIRIERKSVSVPSSLFDESPVKQSALTHVRNYYQVEHLKRGQKKFTFDETPYRGPDVKAALKDQFQGKCAYCESELADVLPNEIARHRPRTFASSNGVINEDYYWWLAYEWENIYHVCVICNRSKGRRFPVEGARAAIGTPYSDVLDAEKALLIDPCNDDPNAHLAFDDTGLVGGLTPNGQATIDILALNRADLVSSRQQTLAIYRSALRLAMKSGEGVLSSVWLGELNKTLREPGPYLAARRQLAARELNRQMGRGNGLLSPSRMLNFLGKITGRSTANQLLSDLVALIPPIELSATALKQKVAESQADADFSVEVGRKKIDRAYFEKSRLLESVEIRDFKKIRSVTLDLTRSQSPSGPWAMLLGENGVGKSSTLQAIALTMIGAKYVDQLNLNPAMFIRNGASKASVAIKITGRPEPLTLTIDKNGFRHSSVESKVLTLAYGAVRLMQRDGAAKGIDLPYAKVDNLFNPLVPVGDPEAWLSAENTKSFNKFARSLKDVFFVLADDDTLVRRNGKLSVKSRQGNVSFSQLSDGYQSVIGITADIMRVLSSAWDAMEAAEGLVLIDELGAHLHPRWRMRIVSGLRKAFPRVQFIVSTHDPLCLRGLLPGEVFVVEDEDETGVPYIVTDVPDVSKMTAEQLLTSEFFGLHSTVDPELDNKFKRYLQLKAEPESEVVKAQISSLEADLRQDGVLGKDRRERMMLETIDSYLAEERTLTGPEDRELAKKETQERLALIWLEVPPVPEVDGENAQ